jgi:hypothetical protein
MGILASPNLLQNPIINGIRVQETWPPTDPLDIIGLFFPDLFKRKYDKAD